jgi:hypothetical protein
MSGGLFGIKIKAAHRNILKTIIMPLSFAIDIRPLFRDSQDIDFMQGHGLDLSSYEDVQARAPEIYARLADGSMPCDEPWPPERLRLFKLWMDEGLAP